MKLLLFFMTLYSTIAPIPFEQNNSLVEKNGMQVRWAYQNDRVHFTMEAPTSGWVAIGFNHKDQLKGTNLIMATVKDGQLVSTDGYILHAGNHQTVEILGGSNQLADLQGQEKTGKTTISFSLPIKAVDDFHFDLNTGTPFYLLMAYSVADDFAHHSIMRTSTRITL